MYLEKHQWNLQESLTDGGKLTKCTLSTVNCTEGYEEDLKNRIRAARHNRKNPSRILCDWKMPVELTAEAHKAVYTSTSVEVNS
jgi:hypothetical protein